MFEYTEHLMYWYYDLYWYIRPSFWWRTTQFIWWWIPLSYKDMFVSMMCFPNSQYLFYLAYHMAIRPLIIDPGNL